MGSDWELLSLGELVSHKKGHAFKSKDYRNRGQGIVRVSDFTDRSINVESCNYLAEELAKDYTSVKLKAGDVIVATVGSWPTNPASVVGKTVKVPNEAESFLLNQNAVKLTANESLDQTFLFHLLKTEKFQGHIISSAQGSASQASITLKSIFDFSTRFPPLQEQKAIAHILGSLDDKIELNRKMNETLEGMAQALFKSWFVDFDPVIDNILVKNLKEHYANDSSQEYPSPPPLPGGEEPSKAESLSSWERLGEGILYKGIPEDFRERAEVRLKTLGERSSCCVTSRNDGAGVPSLPDSSNLPNIGNLFPSSFRESEELGWIPEGWEVSTIGKETKIVGGGTPSTKHPDFWEGGEYPWVTPKDFSALQDKVLLASSRFLTEEGLKKVSSGLLPKGTVLLSSRAPVGYLAITQIDTAINQGFIAMICDRRLPPEYVLQWTLSIMDDIHQAASGSTFAEISKKIFRPFQVIVPDFKPLEDYTTIVAPLYSRITDSVATSNNLTKLRDTLLSKLISGELRIEDAENMLEEAGV